MKQQDSFWSRPDGVSIVDVLALSFTLMYGGIIAVALLSRDHPTIVQIQSNMNLPISTILGGYFGDQIVRHWHREKKQTEENQGPTI